MLRRNQWPLREKLAKSLVLYKGIGGEMEEIGWRLFFVQVIGALSWPAAFVMVAFGFRKEVKILLSRLKALKVSGAEIGFSDLLDEASREAAVIPAMQTPSTCLKSMKR